MKERIIKSYQGNTMFLQNILTGLNDEDTLLSVGESNTIGWILGHIVLGRGQILKKLNKECEIKEIEKYFERGAEKRKDIKLNLAETMNELSSRGTKITEAVNTMSDEELNRTLDIQLPFGTNTVGTYLSMLAWHETFHLGQIDLIKAAVGKGGIK